MALIVERSKRYKEAAKKAVVDLVNIDRGIDLLKGFNPTKFDQSVELIFSLGIDPKQADQMIRGSLSLPHGVGKTKRVVAFCPDHLAPAATAAGAIRRGRPGIGGGDREGKLHRLRCCRRDSRHDAFRRTPR